MPTEPDKIRPAASAIPLQAGPLSMGFEPDTGFLRRIFLGCHEMLRGIYVAVRDRNWRTVPVEVNMLHQEINRDSFELVFVVDCRDNNIHFRWNGRISGAPNGALRYSFDGEALTTFLRNRVGFCVLHPLQECCGARVRFQRIDGQSGEVRFPTLIEPQIIGRNPLSGLRAMSHEIEAGCWVKLEFTGDIFETEDQRNWTDASFKTYCTPLALPFPVKVHAGTHLSQVITLQLETLDRGRLAATESLQLAPAEGVVGTRLTVPRAHSGSMPMLGLSAPSHRIPLTNREAELLGSLQMSHLRADIRLAQPGWAETLNQVIAQALQLGAGLELAISLAADGSGSVLQQCAVRLKQAQGSLHRIFIFRQGEPVSSLETLRLARRHLGFAGVSVGGGTDAHFCDLNRDHTLGKFGLAEADCVCWPITPQVHAFDNLSVMQNLEAQPCTVATARAFAGNKPLCISPITLRPRFNAVATSTATGTDPDQLPPEVDPRQPLLFNAAWTLGSIAALSAAQVASLTYFETTGWRGLMESQTPASRHPQFPSIPSMVFPIYHVFAAIAGFCWVAAVTQEPLDACRDSGSIAALCLFDALDRRRVLCANLTSQLRNVTFDLGVNDSTVRNLDSADCEPGTEKPSPGWSSSVHRTHLDGALQVALRPYSIVSVDTLIP